MAKNKNIVLWSEDEVHFQQYGSRCRMWVPPESKEPILRHHPTRKSVGYFGAINLSTGKMVFQREDDKFNAQTFLKFMKKLKRHARSSGIKIVLLLDNARYHHAKLHQEWRQKHKDDIELLFLPSYSPDLNPIERLWKLTRRICIHNQYFPDLQHLLEPIEAQFIKWKKPNGTIKKLCAII
jgi:transposase